MRSIINKNFKKESKQQGLFPAILLPIITMVLTGCAVGPEGKIDEGLTTYEANHKIHRVSSVKALANFPVSNESAAPGQPEASIETQGEHVLIQWQAVGTEPDHWHIQRWNRITAYWETVKTLPSDARQFRHVNHYSGAYRLYALSEGVLSAPAYLHNANTPKEH